MSVSDSTTPTPITAEERIQKWRESMESRITQRGNFAGLTDVAAAIVNLEDEKAGWREKWINDKGLRDERIAELEAALASCEQERDATRAANAHLAAQLIEHDRLRTTSEQHQQAKL
jgi:hypothetical protein